MYSQCSHRVVHLSLASILENFHRPLPQRNPIPISRPSSIFPLPLGLSFKEVLTITQLTGNLDTETPEKSRMGVVSKLPALGLAHMKCSGLVFRKYLNKRVNQHPKIRTQTCIMCKLRATVYLWGRDRAMATPGLEPKTLEQ